MYFIGLDIGTTNIKALLMNDKAEAVHTAIIPETMSQDSEGRPVYDPIIIWDKVKCCLSECIHHAGPDEIRGIAISSMAEAGLPLDKGGNPLYGIIPWNDTRAESELELIKERFSPLCLYRKTGQPLNTKYPLGKLIWLRKHKPSIFEQTKTWLSVGDYILYKLTGELATDYTQAVRTMFYNIADKRWDKELMDYCGTDGIFPSVYSFGTAAGSIRKTLMNELGLKYKVHVSVGAHDHLLAYYAVNPKHHEIIDSMGTSEVFAALCPTSSPNLDERCLDAGIAQGLYDSGSYYWMTSLPSSGASIEWLNNLLSCTKKLTYEEILKLSDESLENDIIYLPYLNGKGTPNIDPAAKGSFINIGFSDDIRHLLKAIYEGTAFQTKLILDTLSVIMGIEPKKLIAVGGGAKNDTWLRIKARILSMEIETAGIQEMSAYGAALASAGSFGIKPGDLAFKRKKIDAPKDSRNDYYNNKYEMFKHYIGVLS